MEKLTRRRYTLEYKQEAVRLSLRCGKFHSGQQYDRLPLAGVDRALHTADFVMVRDRNHGKAFTHGGIHNRFRRHRGVFYVVRSTERMDV